MKIFKVVYTDVDLFDHKEYVEEAYIQAGSEVEAVSIINTLANKHDTRIIVSTNVVTEPVITVKDKTTRKW